VAVAVGFIKEAGLGLRLATFKYFLCGLMQVFIINIERVQFEIYIKSTPCVPASFIAMKCIESFEPFSARKVETF